VLNQTNLGDPKMDLVPPASVKSPVLPLVRTNGKSSDFGGARTDQVCHAPGVSSQIRTVLVPQLQWQDSLLFGGTFISSGHDQDV